MGTGIFAVEQKNKVLCFNYLCAHRPLDCPQILRRRRIYHSHPDHPSKPSQFDTDRAWPGYSYIIGSVSNGSVEKLQSWELNESERKFYEEPLDIQEEE